MNTARVPQKGWQGEGVSLYPTDFKIHTEVVTRATHRLSC